MRFDFIYCCLFCFDYKDEENYGHKERCDTAKGVIPA